MIARLSFCFGLFFAIAGCFQWAGSVAAQTCGANETCMPVGSCMGTAGASCGSGMVCCNNTGAPSSTAPQNTNDGRYYTLEKVPGAERTSSLVAYLESVYKFGIGIAAILAVFMIGMGAFQYIISSAGNAVKMGDGKDMMTSAIFGLVLVMVIYITVFLINPDMLKGSIKNSTMSSDYTRTGMGEPGTTPTLPIGCDNNPKVDQAISSAAGGDANLENTMKALVRCGEGCNPNKSSAGACGYGQTIASIRKWCGIGGTSAESCAAVQNDTTLDINCATHLVKDDFMKRCGTDIRQVASCYNTGKPNNCAKAQNNYCDRVANCH